MKNKVNQLRNEIVNAIENLVSKRPEKTVVLFADMMDIAENNPPFFSSGLKYGGLSEDYAITKVSINKDGLLQFHGIQEESGETKIQESDYLHLDTLADTYELIVSQIALEDE